MGGFEFWVGVEGSTVSIRDLGKINISMPFFSFSINCAPINSTIIFCAIFTCAIFTKIALHQLILTFI